MRGFLRKIIDRRLQQVTMATTLGVAMVATAAVAAERWKDARFEDANLAVEKAQRLLSATACDGGGARATVSCERLVRQAGELLEQAQRALSAAATVVDGGDVVLPAGSSDKR